MATLSELGNPVFEILPWTLVRESLIWLNLKTVQKYMLHFITGTSYIFTSWCEQCGHSNILTNFTNLNMMLPFKNNIFTIFPWPPSYRSRSYCTRRFCFDLGDGLPSMSAIEEDEMMTEAADIPSHVRNARRFFAELKQFSGDSTHPGNSCLD